MYLYTLLKPFNGNDNLAKDIIAALGNGTLDLEQIVGKIGGWRDASKIQAKLSYLVEQGCLKRESAPDWAAEAA